MLFTPSYNLANYRQITEHWQWVSSELSSQGLNRLWESDSHSGIGLQQIDAWVSLLVIMIFLLRAPYDSHIAGMRNNNHGWHQMWISSHKDGIQPWNMEQIGWGNTTKRTSSPKQVQHSELLPQPEWHLHHQFVQHWRWLRELTIVVDRCKNILKILRWSFPKQRTVGQLCTCMLLPAVSYRLATRVLMEDKSRS
jgi:hypothetical protein